MKISEIQAKIDATNYWDERALGVDCNYFGDEVRIVLENGVQYEFKGCYSVKFDHVKEYDKLRPVAEMTVPQIPYFMQDITVGELCEENAKFLSCRIKMFPLEVEIYCKEILVHG